MNICENLNFLKNCDIFSFEIIFKTNASNYKNDNGRTVTAAFKMRFLLHLKPSCAYSGCSGDINRS
jgi:hypothetical protein